MYSTYLLRDICDEPITILEAISEIYESCWNDYSSCDDFTRANEDHKKLKTMLLNHCK